MGERGKKRRPAADSLSFAVPAAARSRSTAQGSSNKLSLKETSDQALELIRQGKLSEAETLYRAALTKGQANEDILCNLAFICGTKQKWKEAIVFSQQILDKNPDHFEACTNIAAAYLNTGDHDAAISHLERAVRIRPNQASAHANLAKALQEKGLFEEAVERFQRAMLLNPDDPESPRLIASCLLALDRHNAAIAALQALLSRHPDDPLTHADLGTSFYLAGDVTAAIGSYRECLRRMPGHASCHCNLGVALVEQGSLDEAISHFETSMRIDPDNPESHFNASMAYLYRPDRYAIGWKSYEWRSRRRQNAIFPDAIPPGDPWDGGPLNPGEPLLLVSEQGYGDTLQFMRYAHVLRQRHQAAVRLCAPQKLHGLIRSSGLCDEPLTPEQASGLAIPWIAMMSLPGRLGVTPQNVLWNRPYIRPAAALRERWRERLRQEDGPVVAIHWQGNPDHERAVTRGRSLPLEAFAPLAEIPGINLLSLQKGCGSEQLAGCSFRHRFARCQEEVDAIWDFEETAAILAACDLLISSDTAIIHLAGGMGLPAWLLLKQVPEWRWGLEGERTFWYPSLRLFRQKRRGDWGELMERVAEALAGGLPGEPGPAGAARAPGSAAAAAGTAAEPEALPPEVRAATTPATGSAAASDAGPAPERAATGHAAAGAEESGCSTETTGGEHGGFGEQGSPQSGETILAPISIGELIDRITILELKLQHLSGEAQRNVARELTALNGTLAALDLQIDAALVAGLRKVNASLWRIEDAIRDKERQQDFGDAFIALARSVYRENDRRAALKRQINRSCGSALQEEKSYTAY